MQQIKGSGGRDTTLRQTRSSPKDFIAVPGKTLKSLVESKANKHQWSKLRVVAVSLPEFLEEADDGPLMGPCPRKKLDSGRAHRYISM